MAGPPAKRRNKAVLRNICLLQAQDRRTKARHLGCTFPSWLEDVNLIRGDLYEQIRQVIVSNERYFAYLNGR